MVLKFVQNKNKKYKICTCCLEPVELEESYFDGEDYWHLNCHEEFTNKMESLNKGGNCTWLSEAHRGKKTGSRKIKK